MYEKIIKVVTLGMGGDRMFGDVGGIETFYSVLTFETCKSPLFNNKVLKNFLMCF